MEFIWAILGEMGRVLVATLTTPSFLLIYLLLVGLVTFQYYRLQKTSPAIGLRCKIGYISAAMVSSALGLGGGIVGSILLVFLGVDLAEIGIGQLWLVAFLLMLIKPRFLCFAYAAGLLSISNLLFGYPHINIPQLMGLVAVLHLVESMLILLNGAYRPFPVYIMKKGGLRGGFNLQRFWPLPLVALVSASFADPSHGIVTPDWWPGLQNYSHFTTTHTYALVPVLAMLGYGEISTTQSPRRAVQKSSLNLFLFSLGLLLLAMLAAHNPVFLPLAALFSPLGHELVIWLGMRAENRSPLFTMAEAGVKILDVLPGTPAAKAGLRSGDVVVAMNGEALHSYAEMQEQWLSNWQTKTIQVRRGDICLNPKLIPGPGHEFGIIPVPDFKTEHYWSITEDSLFRLVSRCWQRLKSS